MVLKMSFSWLRTTVHEQGLAELEPGNVAVQVARIFRGR
jgi:hypothetical protein